jgi:hypothetical protein
MVQTGVSNSAWHITKPVPYFLIGVCSTLFLLCITLFVFKRIQSQDDIIGEFRLPVMSSWKKDIYHSDITERVIYTRKIKGNSLRLYFSYSRTPGLRRRLSTEIKKQLIKFEKVHVQILSSEGKKSFITSIKEESSRYGPTLIITTTTYWGKATVYTRNRFFYYNGEFYTVISTLIEKTYLPEAASAEKSAWENFWKKIAPR